MFNAVFSRRLAIVGGALLPLMETARRWREWPGPVDTWIPWIDDYILGAILLGAAWVSRPKVGDLQSGENPAVRRLSWLTGAWGFVCGCGFGSTLAQLHFVIHPESDGNIDPSGMSHGWVVLAKAGLVAVGLVGLFSSMRPGRSGEL